MTSKRILGLNHIGIRVRIIEGSDIKRFEDNGCRIIPGGKGYAFIHPKTANGVLYKIAQKV